MTSIQKQMGMIEWSMLIMLSIVWGGSFFFNAILVKELPPFTIVFFRVFLASITLLLVLKILGQHFPVNVPALRAFAVMGFVNNVIPFSLIVWGQTEVASGIASVINAMTPLMTALVTHVFTSDEKLTGPKVFGLIAGFTGVALLMNPGSERLNWDQLWPYIALLGATLSYGFAGLQGRKFKMMGISPLQAATGQVTLSSLLLFPIMLYADQPWLLSFPSSNTVISLVLLAVLSTALAYLLFFNIMHRAGPTNTSLVTFLVPVSAIALGFLILDERFLPHHLQGMVAIIFGLIVFDGRLLKFFSKSKHA